MKPTEFELNDLYMFFVGREDIDFEKYSRDFIEYAKAYHEARTTGIPCLKAGYHLTDIPKGVLGEISKIQEELHELNDALHQGSRIMAAVEMSDLYGALEAFVEAQGYSMDDLKSFSNITKRAFKNGRR